MEDYYQLIIAYFDKTISDEGLTRLQQWIDESVDNQALFTETIQILEASRLYLKTPKSTDQSWKKIQNHITITHQPTKTTPQKWNWLSVAAACLAVCVSGWLGYSVFKSSTQPVYASISNADGKHSKIVLPDSSIVILSGGSTLKYLKNFDSDKREIMLDGEAFFDVMHQAKRPFIIKTGQISTVVFGTSFNIKAYKTDKNIIVTVASGKVGVLANTNEKGRLVRYLVKNEQISINTQTGLYTSNTIDAGTVTGWVSNNLAFYNTRFKDIATSLEHHYGVKIHFTDAELGNVRLTAKFKNLSLNQAMDNLCSLTGLGYTQKQNQVFISNNDQKGGSIMR
jgi:transmembrane sensor